MRVCEKIKETENIETAITSFKPPIFWKDKEVINQQIKIWSYGNIKKLIYRINDVELLIKKNSNSSVNILSDFIIEQSA